MQPNEAIETLSALAQESRLTVFRLLVKRGPQGLSAGEIAEQVGMPHNTLSTHLAILSRARLVDSEKLGRQKIFRARMDRTAELVDFLVSDCCEGNPDLCESVVLSLRQNATPETELQSAG